MQEIHEFEEKCFVGHGQLRDVKLGVAHEFPVVRMCVRVCVCCVLCVVYECTCTCVKEIRGMPVYTQTQSTIQTHQQLAQTTRYDM